MRTIITIGRQYGSAGHQIGKALADELGIAYYDKELLERAAKESGMCEELFENHDERPTNSFLYSLVMDTYSFGYGASSLSENPNCLSIFIHADLQLRIRRIAAKYDLTDAKAKDKIIKTDKRRSSYYNYYTSRKWGDIDSYNLSFDSGLLGVNGTVEMIKKAVEWKEKSNTDKKMIYEVTKY